MHGGSVCGVWVHGGSVCGVDAVGAWSRVGDSCWSWDGASSRGESHVPQAKHTGMINAHVTVALRAGITHAPAS